MSLISDDPFILRGNNDPRKIPGFKAGSHPSCVPIHHDFKIKKTVLQQNLWVNWGSAPDPGIFGGMAPVFQATKKPRSSSATGQVLGRTVGRVIPCQVASPQSLALFGPAG